MHIYSCISCRIIALLVLFTLAYTNNAPNITYSNEKKIMVDGVRCATPVPTIEQQYRVQSRIQEWTRLGRTTSRNVITIPVAVHVVRGDNGEWDVTDIQIQDQIDVLNAAFLSQNFQFTLTSTDRTDNSEWSQHSYGSSEEIAMKSSLAISPETTLNMYFCNIGGGILGYATFPDYYDESDTRHGVVCAYGTVPGGIAYPYDGGDTGTHEVGHYVGLRHVWGDGDCTVDDFVSDTPNQSGPNYDCDENADTCPSDPGNDPVHNFMNYGDDLCLTEFTAGQSSRAHSIMSIYKPTIYSQTVSDSYITTDEDTDYTGTLSELGLEGSLLTFAIVTDPVNGTIVLNDASSGSYTYIPLANFNGSDSLTYSVNDGSTTETGTVSITVNSVNDAPVASDTAFTTNQGEAVAVAFSATDIDGDALSYAVVDSPANGTVSVPQNFSEEGFENGSMPTNWTVYQLADENDAWELVSDEAHSGSYSVFHDDNQVSNSAEDWLVSPAIDLSEMVNAELSFWQKNEYMTNYYDYHGVWASPTSGNPLTDQTWVELSEESTTHSDWTETVIDLSAYDGGTVYIAFKYIGDWATHWWIDDILVDGAVSPSYTYYPNADFNGSDSFTFTANDGETTSNTATVNIIVYAVGDSLTASDISITTDEDTDYTGTFPVSGSDGLDLTFAITADPVNGSITLSDASAGSYTYSPSENFNGSDSLSYSVTDGSTTAIGTVIITVNSVNDAPVALDASITTDQDTDYSGTLSGSDVDGDELTFAIITNPANGTATLATNSSTGTFSYIPTSNYIGSDSFIYTVSDSALIDTATISIVVRQANTEPAEFALLSPADSAEVTTLTPLFVWATANDPDITDTVRYKLYMDTPDDPGVVIISVDTATSYQWPTSLSDNTTHYWKVVATDLSGSSVENTGGYQNFRVNTANDLPSDFDLLTPENNSIITTLSPTFHWEEPIDPDDRSRSIVSYLVYLDTIITDLSPYTVYTNSYTLSSELAEDATYFWKVEALDNDGGIKSSELWSFKTNSENSPPSGFTLLEPSNNLVLNDLNPLFIWHRSDDSDPADTLHYKLFLDTPEPGVVVFEVGTDTSFVITDSLTDNFTSPLMDNTQYFWQVAAIDLSGFETTSENGYQMFYTNVINDPPNPSILVAPLNGSIQTDLTPNFYWTEAVDPDPLDHVSYTMHWWPLDVLGFFSVETDTNSFSPEDNFSDNSHFGWMVKAMDINGSQSNSDTTYFFTDVFPEPPLAFNSVSPEDSSVGLDAVVEFIWNHTEDPDPVDAITYTLVYATDWTDSSTYSWIDNIEDTTVSITLADNAEYFWLVEAHDTDNFITLSNNGNLQQLVVGVLSTDENSIMPTEFALHQNYPNPFNPVTTIRYDIPEAGEVRLDVYNTLGEKVATLAQGNHHVGRYTIRWDAAGISSGMYFYRISSAKFTATKKLVLMK
jgi:hypothetical protein